MLNTFSLDDYIAHARNGEWLDLILSAQDPFIRQVVSAHGYFLDELATSDEIGRAHV